MLLALCVGQMRGTVDDATVERIVRELKNMPLYIKDVLGLADKIKNLSKIYTYARNFLYLGRGYNYPTALEGALKLKEISYIHAEGYPAAEMKILYNTLSIIQSQIDKIRNVPSDTLLTYQRIKEERLSWKKQVDKIYDDYESAKKANVGYAASGTGLGVGVAFLGPSAAMGIATTFGVASTGTAISALSGAAATNAALAWLGGGALAAGGGGMAAGNALLALAGPVGWTIAGLSLLGSGIFFLKSLNEKKKLENIFLLISLRDEKKYQMAIVELNERLSRIADETKKLQEAIINISSFGYDYNSMTEDQQYALGSYVNLMNSATQLLVNPILGLQPNYTDSDLSDFISWNVLGRSLIIKSDKYKSLIVYLVNLFWAIQVDDSDMKLFINSLKKNKDFLTEMGLSKDELDEKLIKYIQEAIRRKKNQMKD